MSVQFRRKVHTVEVLFDTSAAAILGSVLLQMGLARDGPDVISKVLPSVTGENRLNPEQLDRYTLPSVEKLLKCS